MEFTYFVEKKNTGGWFIKICCKDREQLESPVIKTEIKDLLNKEIPGLELGDITYDPYQPIYPVGEDLEPIIGADNRPRPGFKICSFCRDFDVSVFPKFNAGEHNKNTVVVQYGEIPQT